MSVPPTGKDSEGLTASSPRGAGKRRLFLSVSGGLVLFCLGIVATFVFLAILLVVGLGTGLEEEHDEREEALVATLRLPDADDESLLSALRAERDGEEQKIPDAMRRKELTWRLVAEIIRRGRFAEVKETVLRILPANPESDEIGARRLLTMARALLREGDWDNARNYYRAAQRSTTSPEFAQEVLREHALLLAIGCGDYGEDIRFVDELAQKFESMPAEMGLLHELLLLDPDLALTSPADAQQRTINRRRLREFLDRYPAERAASCSAALNIYLGCAHRLFGEDEDALDFIKTGIQKLSGEMTTGARCFRALALETLAQSALRYRRTHAALVLLERADAELRDALPEHCLLHARITNCRAWALYQIQRYEHSLALFRKQLEQNPPDHPLLRMSPLEGIARSCLALGNPEGATDAVEECIRLRLRHTPDRKGILGSLYLLQAQCYEREESLMKSAALYAKAVEVLPMDHPLYHEALSGQATVLMQAQKWEDACDVWEKLLPLVPEIDRMQQEEIESQIKYCRSMLGQEPQEEQDAHGPS